MDLNVFWFWTVALFFCGYFILDGFDFGVGISLPFLGKDNVDRRVIINTIGPIWDLNETWVIVGGGVLFASFPHWYATIFSGMYLALLLMLLALIARGVSFEYRHQGHGRRWTNWFDWMIFVGSVVPALLWGVAFANIVQGLPMDEHFNYTGSFFELLNPYALLGGLTTLTLFWYHGIIFLTRKTEGEMRLRAQRLATSVGLVVALLAIAFLTWTLIEGFSFQGLALSLVAVLAFVVSWLANLRGRDGIAFFSGVGTILCAVLALFASLFFAHETPMLVVNTADPANSLTIYNGSSSPLTLGIMSWAAIILVPFILLYQGWTFWVFRKRIRRQDIERHETEHAAAHA